jgi:hypothetical protein
MSWRAPEIPPLTHTVLKPQSEKTVDTQTIELTRREKKDIAQLGKRILNYEKIFTDIEKKAKHTVARSIAVTALALTTVFGINEYMRDTHQNQANENKVKVTIQTIEKVAGSSAIIVADGFNSLGGNYVATKIGPAVQQVDNGSLAPLTMGDAPPSSNEVANTAVEYTETENVSELSLLGYSVGGDELLQAAPEIIEKSNAQIRTIFLGSTPAGLESLRPEKQQIINALAQVLSYIPWSEDSTYVKKLVSFLLRANTFLPQDENPFEINWVNAGTAWNDAAAEVASNARPGISTLEYQIGLAKSNVEDAIRGIAESSETANKVVPTIVYLLIENDDTVDNVKAADTMGLLCEKYGVPFIIITVQSQHSHYYTDESVASYNQELASKRPIIQQVQKNQEKLYQAKQDEKNTSNAEAVAEQLSQHPSVSKPHLPSARYN